MIFPLVLAILSLLTHLIFFGYPSAVVFDEVYNGNFISAYSTGAYYFDVHPALAKLMVKFLGDIIGIPYDVDYGMIGNALPWGVILLRLLPLVSGIVLPLVIYYICRNLNMSRLASFTAGALICLENSLVVHSRFILFDSIMLILGFLSILLYLIYAKGGKTRSRLMFLLISSALLSAGAFSIKWTGLAFPLLIAILEIVRVKKFWSIVKFLSVYAFIGLVFYMSVFAAHFYYLDHSGRGDNFMTDRFQKTLIGNQHENNPSIEPKGFFGKFIELNFVMYDANKRMTSAHDYSSEWHTWPFMKTPIFYWQSTPVSGHYIYFLGNPFIYWFGALSIILLIFLSIFSRRSRIGALFILAGFFVNYAPFIFIGRVMFLYHYQAALVFSIMAVAFLVDKTPLPKTKISLFSCIIFISSVLFVYFSPLTYGLPLSDSQLTDRMWLSSWR